MNKNNKKIVIYKKENEKMLKGNFETQKNIK